MRLDSAEVKPILIADGVPCEVLATLDVDGDEIEDPTQVCFVVAKTPEGETLVVEVEYIQEKVPLH